MRNFIVGMSGLPPNPFNPGSPVDPNDFVGRSRDLENFRQKLRQTIEGSVASMSVAGGYGIGKTSFLHKCKALAEEQNALTVYFSINEIGELSREKLAMALISRITEKISEEVILQRISNNILHALKKIKIKTEAGIEFSLDETNQDNFPNLQSALCAAWNSLKGHKSAIVFLIDEARALERKRADLVLYLRAVLEQLQITKTPVMIVPAGKLTITGPSGTGFSPLVRTFPPAILENFSYEESASFIERKLGKVHIAIGQETMKRIYDNTEGHPFVLTAYLATAYSKLTSQDKELRVEHLDAADIEFVNRVLSPFFSRFYDQASKGSRPILSHMASSTGTETSLSDLSGRLHKQMNEISPHLGKLVQEGAIIRTDRGKYKLFHHLLGTYIKNKNGSAL